MIHVTLTCTDTFCTEQVAGDHDKFFSRHWSFVVCVGIIISPLCPSPTVFCLFSPVLSNSWHRLASVCAWLNSLFGISSLLTSEHWTALPVLRLFSTSSSAFHEPFRNFDLLCFSWSLEILLTGVLGLAAVSNDPSNCKIESKATPSLQGRLFSKTTASFSETSWEETDLWCDTCPAVAECFLSVSVTDCDCESE